MPQRGLERPRQFRAGPFQFGAMCQGEFAQNRAAGRRQPDPYFAFILSSGTPLDSPGLFQPVDQFHRTVMLDEQPRCDLPNRRAGAFRQSVHGQQQLVLLRLQAVLLCGRLAEVKKPADLPAEFGQIAILIGR